LLGAVKLSSILAILRRGRVVEDNNKGLGWRERERERDLLNQQEEEEELGCCCCVVGKWSAPSHHTGGGIHPTTIPNLTLLVPMYRTWKGAHNDASIVYLTSIGVVASGLKIAVDLEVPNGPGLGARATKFNGSHA
jgi:hypothetical protein